MITAQRIDANGPRPLKLRNGQRIRLLAGQILSLAQDGVQTQRQGNDLVLIVPSVDGQGAERVVIVGFFSQGNNVEVVLEGGHQPISVLSPQSDVPVVQPDSDQAQSRPEPGAESGLINSALNSDLRVDDTRLRMFESHSEAALPVFDAPVLDFSRHVASQLFSIKTTEATTQRDVTAPDAPVINLPPAIRTVGGVQGLNRAAVLGGSPFSGTAESGSQIEFAVTDTQGHRVTVKATADASGRWQVSLPAGAMLELADGALQIQAVAVDASNNRSVTSSGPALELHAMLPAEPQSVSLAAISDTGSSNSDHITNLRFPQVTGHASAGQRLLVWADNNRNGEADSGEQVGDFVVTGNTFTWIPTSALTDGSYTYLLMSVDEWGNTSTASAVTFTVDTTLTPPLTLDPVATDNNINYQESQAAGSLLLLSGNAEVGATVQITISQGAANITYTTIASSSNKWSLSNFGAEAIRNAGFIAGALTFTVTQTDVAGNTSLSVTRNVPIFITSVAEPGTSPGGGGTLLPPSLLALDAADDSGQSNSDKITNQTSELTLRGAVAAGLSVRVLDDVNNNGLYDAGESLGVAVSDASTGAFSLDVSLPTGTHNLRAMSFDGSGQASIPNAPTIIVVDTTLSTPLTLDAVATDNMINYQESNTAGSVIALSGKAEAGATVKITISQGAATTTYTTTATSLNEWSLNEFGVNAISAAGFADGTLTFTVTQTDIAGNTSLPVSRDVPIRASSLPAISSFVLESSQDTGVVGDNVTRVSEPIFSGAGPANMTARIYNGTVLVGEAAIDGQGQFTFVLPANNALIEGANILEVQSYDPITTSTSATNLLLTVTLDTQVSPPTFDTVAGDDVITAAELIAASTGITIGGAAEAGASVTVQLTAGSTSQARVITANSAGAWSFAYSAADATLLGNGTVTMTATQTDLADNTSSKSPATKTFTVMTSALKAPSLLTLATEDDSGVDHDDRITNQTNGLTLSGAAAAGLSVRIFNDVNGNGLYEAGEELGVGVADSSGAFRLDVSLAAGAHNLRAMASDSFGQVSAPNSPTAITVDTIVDVPTATSATDNAINQDEGSAVDAVLSKASISGTGEVNAAVQIEWVSQANTSVVLVTQTDIGVGADGRWSATLSNSQVAALSEGALIARVTQVDRAGNLSAAYEQVVIYDKTLPGTPSMAEAIAASAYNTDVDRPWVDGITWGDLYQDVNGVATPNTLQLAVATTAGLVTNDSVTLNWGGQRVTQLLTQTDIARGYVLVGVSGNVIAAAGASVGLSVTASFTDVVGNAGASFNVMTGIDVPLTQRPPTLLLSDSAQQNSDNPSDTAWYSSHGVGNTDVAQRNFTVKGMAEPGSRVTVFVDVNGDGNFNTGDMVLTLVNSDPATGGYSSTFVSSLADGNYSIRAVSKIGSSARSWPTDAQTLHLDTMAPALPTVTQTSAALGGDGMVNAVERVADLNNDGKGDGVPIRGTGEAYATITLRLTNSSTGVVGSERTVKADANGSWSYNLNVVDWGQVGEGNIEINVWQVDLSGNRSSGEVVRNVVYDATVAAPTLDPVTGDNYLNAADYTTANANGLLLQGSGEPGGHVYLDLKGANGVSTGRLEMPLTNSQGRWEFTLTPALFDLSRFGQGPVTVELYQVDAASNSTINSKVNRTFTIDTQVSAPTLDLVAVDDRINASEKTNGVLLSGSAEAGATVTLTLTQDSVVKTFTVSTGTATIWQYNLSATDLAGLSDGPVSVKVQQTDAAHNVSGLTTRNIELAVNPLAAVTLNPVSGDDRVALSEQSADVLLSGSGPANSTLTLQLSGLGGSISTTVSIGSNGLWIYNLTPTNMTALGQGAVSVHLWASTGATADQSSPVLSTSLLLEAAEPAPVLNAVSSNSWVNAQEAAAGVDLGGSGITGHIVTVTLTGSNGSSLTRSAVVGSDGNWVLGQPLSASDIQNLGEGNVSVSLQQKASNLAGAATSVAISSSFAIDTIAPVVPIGGALAVANAYNQGTSAVKDGSVTVDEANAGVVISVPWHTGRAVGDKVTLYWGGEKIEKIVTAADASGLQTFTVTVPSENIAAAGSGTFDVRAIYTDAAGNSSPALTLVSGLVVAAPPVAPTFSTISTDGYINATEYASIATTPLAISGTAAGSGSVTLVVSRGGVSYTYSNLAVTGGTWTASVPQADLNAMGEGTISTEAIFTRIDGVTKSATGTFVFDRTPPSAPTDTSLQAAGEANAISELAGGLIRLNGATTEAATDVQVRVAVPGNAAAGDTLTLMWGSVNATVTAVMSQAAISLGYMTVIVPSTLITTVGDSASLTVSARYTDKAGNQGAVFNVWTGVVDAVPLSPAIGAFAVGEWLNRSEATAGWSVAGTCQNGSTVELTFTGVSGSFTKTVAAVGTAWTQPNLTLADAQTLGEGTVTISAIQRDSNGNPSAPATSALKIDLTAPGHPTLDAVQSLSYAQTQNGVTYSGTADGGAQVSVTFTRGVNTLIKTVTAGNNGIWSLQMVGADYALLAANSATGSVSLTAQQSDAAANQSLPSTARSFDFSSTVITPPTFTSVTGLGGSDAVLNGLELAANSDNFVIQGTGIANQKVLLNFTVGGVPTATTLDVAANGTWSYTLTKTELAGFGQGAASLRATSRVITGGLTDESLASNFTVNGGTNFTIDTVAPSVLQASISANGSSGNAKAGDTLTVTLSTSEAITLGSGSPTLTLKLDGSDRTATYEAAASAALGGNRMVFTYLVVNGDNASVVSVATATALNLNGTSASDAAGNLLLTPIASAGTNTVLVDTTAPNAPSISAVSATDAASLGGTTINAEEALGNVQVSVSLTGGNAVVGDTVQVAWGTSTVARLLTSTDINNGSAIVLITQSKIGQTEGRVSVTAQLIDRSGNASAESSAVSVAVDTIAPSAPSFNTWMSDNKLNATEASSVLALTGTGIASTTVGRSLWAELRQGTNTFMLAVADGNDGTWSISSTQLQALMDNSVTEGAFTVAVWQKDQVGNTSTQAVHSYYKDTQAPDQPIISTIAKAADGWINAADAAALTVEVAIPNNPLTQSVAVVGDTLILSGLSTSSLTHVITQAELTAGKVLLTLDSADVLQAAGAAPRTGVGVTARIEDQGGNVSPASPTYSVNIDTSVLAPLVNTGTGVAAGVTAQQAASGLQFTGSGIESNAVVWLVITGGLGETLRISPRVNSDGTYRANLTSSDFRTLGQGYASYEVYQTDPAGNISSKTTGAFNVELNVSAPTLNDFALDNIVGASETPVTQTLSGTGTVGASIDVKVYVGTTLMLTKPSVTVGSDGKWSTMLATGDFTTLLAGGSAATARFEVTASANGITSEATRQEFVVNTAVPSLQSVVVFDANGDGANNDGFVVTFSEVVRVSGVIPNNIATNMNSFTLPSGKNWGTGYHIEAVNTQTINGAQFATQYKIYLGTGANLAQGNSIGVVAANIENSASNKPAANLRFSVPNLSVPTLPRAPSSLLEDNRMNADEGGAGTRLTFVQSMSVAELSTVVGGQMKITASYAHTEGGSTVAKTDTFIQALKVNGFSLDVNFNKALTLAEGMALSLTVRVTLSNGTSTNYTLIATGDELGDSNNLVNPYSSTTARSTYTFTSRQELDLTQVANITYVASSLNTAGFLLPNAHVGATDMTTPTAKTVDINGNPISYDLSRSGNSFQVKLNFSGSNTPKLASGTTSTVAVIVAYSDGTNGVAYATVMGDNITATGAPSLTFSGTITPPTGLTVNKIWWRGDVSGHRPTNLSLDIGGTPIINSSDIKALVETSVATTSTVDANSANLNTQLLNSSGVPQGSAKAVTAFSSNAAYVSSLPASVDYALTIAEGLAAASAGRTIKLFLDGNQVGSSAVVPNKLNMVGSYSTRDENEASATGESGGLNFNNLQYGQKVTAQVRVTFTAASGLAARDLELSFVGDSTDKVGTLTRDISGDGIDWTKVSSVLYKAGSFSLNSSYTLMNFGNPSFVMSVPLDATQLATVPDGVVSLTAQVVNNATGQTSTFSTPKQLIIDRSVDSVQSVKVITDTVDAANGNALNTFNAGDVIELHFTERVQFGNTGLPSEFGSVSAAGVVAIAPANGFSDTWRITLGVGTTVTPGGSYTLKTGLVTDQAGNANTIAKPVVATLATDVFDRPGTPLIDNVSTDNVVTSLTSNTAVSIKLSNAKVGDVVKLMIDGELVGSLTVSTLGQATADFSVAGSSLGADGTRILTSSVTRGNSTITSAGRELYVNADSTHWSGVYANTYWLDPSSVVVADGSGMVANGAVLNWTASVGGGTGAADGAFNRFAVAARTGASASNIIKMTDPVSGRTYLWDNGQAMTAVLNANGTSNFLLPSYAQTYNSAATTSQGGYVDFSVFMPTAVGGSGYLQFAVNRYAQNVADTQWYTGYSNVFSWAVPSATASSMYMGEAHSPLRPQNAIGLGAWQLIAGQADLAGNTIYGQGALLGTGGYGRIDSSGLTGAGLGWANMVANTSTPIVGTNSSYGENDARYGRPFSVGANGILGDQIVITQQNGQAQMVSALFMTEVQTYLAAKYLTTGSYVSQTNLLTNGYYVYDLATSAVTSGLMDQILKLQDVATNDRVTTAGLDYVNTGAGNDIVSIRDLGFSTLDGGTGRDTLVWDSAFSGSNSYVLADAVSNARGNVGSTADNARVAAAGYHKLQGFEVIDLSTSSQRQVLTVAAADVNQLTNSYDYAGQAIGNTLEVKLGLNDILLNTGFTSGTRGLYKLNDLWYDWKYTGTDNGQPVTLYSQGGDQQSSVNSFKLSAGGQLVQLNFDHAMVDSGTSPTVLGHFAISGVDGYSYALSGTNSAALVNQRQGIQLSLTTAVTGAIKITYAGFLTDDAGRGFSSTTWLVGTDSSNTLDASLLSPIEQTAGVTLMGGAGNDVIKGGSGADTLMGGLGIDTLTGGSGSDTFKYVSEVPGVGGAAGLGGTTGDVITDFDFGKTTEVNADRLDLSQLFDPNFGPTGNAAIDSAKLVSGKYLEVVSVINGGKTDWQIWVDRDGGGTYGQLTTLQAVSDSLGGGTGISNTLTTSELLQKMMEEGRLVVAHA